MPRNNPSRSTKRSIYFYSLRHRITDLPFSARDIGQLGNLLRQMRQPPYMQIEDDNVLCGWIDPAQGNPIKFRLGLTRRSALPFTERAGTLTPLALRPDEGISEITHLCLFPQSVAGIEFNFYGPRQNRVADYIYEKTGLPIKFVPLLNPQAAEELQNFNGLKSFELQIESEKLTELIQANASMRDILENVEDYNGLHTLEIRVAVKPRSEDVLDNRFLVAARQIYARLNGRQDLRKFKVKGVSNNFDHAKEIDLLSEYIVSSQQVLKSDARSRSIDTTSAFAAILRSHTELGEQINGALGR